MASSSGRICTTFIVPYTAKDMPRSERKRQFAALGRQLKKEAQLHPALPSKWNAADDSGKLSGKIKPYPLLSWAGLFVVRRSIQILIKLAIKVNRDN